MAKLLRSNTPIPIEILEEMWIVQDEEGHYILMPPGATFTTTGKGAPGIFKSGVQKILAPGTRIAIILP